MINLTPVRLFLFVLLSLSLRGISTLGAPGDLYVPKDQSSGPGGIFRIAPDGSVTTFASGLAAVCVVFDSAGNLYESDRTTNTVFKFAPDGTKTTFASVPGPIGLAFDGSGNLYVGSSGPYPSYNGTIIKITPNGSQSTFAQDPRSGEFHGLAFDQSGNLFVASFNRKPDDTGESAILKVAPDGTLTTFATINPGGQTGSFPNGLVFDGSGNLLVADSEKIWRFTPAGVRTTYAQQAVDFQGLVFDSSGNLFASTTFPQGDVIKFAPNGTSSTFANVGQRPGLLTIQPGTPMPPTASLLNISTRLRVQTGENVLIGGFIVTGTAGKKVIVRAIGPSLANVGIQGFLPDPTLELRDSNATLVASNDNWKINDQTQQSQEAEIRATTIPPSNDLESALVATLSPNQGYTAIVRGKNGAPGIAVVEAYDLDQAADSILANISTRGFVDTGSNVMIGGLILGGGNGQGKVLFRAIGPSLAQAGVANPVSDPVLELYNANGVRQGANDNWKFDALSGESQEAAIRATTVPPSNDLESAILITLPAGSYTAIVSGKGGGTGVGLVEAYNLK
jgi:sugar lactone lactonase YvrE